MILKDSMLGCIKQYNEEVPSWFTVGMKFKSRWIASGDNICEVISFSGETNKATVTSQSDGQKMIGIFNTLFGDLITWTIEK